MCVKGSRGFEVRYWRQPPLLEGRKELGRLGIERGTNAGRRARRCSEFDIRSIGLLISINAGIQMQHIPTESKH